MDSPHVNELMLKARMTKPLVDVEIEYFTSRIADDSQRIRAAADWICRNYEFQSFTVSISIVDDPTIQTLNREQLGHDWPTDVISHVIELEADRVDGEVVASADTAIRMHPAAGWSAGDELLLYTVHGMLHIAGLDDIDQTGRQAMRAAEQLCLESIGVAAAEPAVRWSGGSE